MGLREILPSPADLLELEPEDLAPLILRCLQQAPTSDLHLYNFVLRGSELGQYAGGRYMEVAKAATEAWKVLDREGLIAPKPGDSRGQFVFITRRGVKLLASADFRAYFRGDLHPARGLDPTLATTVRSMFLRGEYDTAVFAAYREVEIRVRAAGNLPHDTLGVQLMRTAFHPTTGPLSETARPTAEREAMMHLFSGAIGLFKNPASHRAVAYEAEEAADLIRFANYLISWVDRGVQPAQP